MGDEQKELTFGEKSVGLTFNPSGDEKVLYAKKICAEFIDLCNDLRQEEHKSDVKNVEKIRLLSTAITYAQSAQMWGVKGITWKD